MTLFQFNATTDWGDELDVPLGDISGGYSVQDIDGLDPVKATIVSSDFASLDGTQFHASRREERNIVLKLGLETDYVTNSPQQLRRTLRHYFATKKGVSLRFLDDELPNGFVDIKGKVESFDCPIFVQDPMATISVLCNDPDFVDTTDITFSKNTSATTDVDTITYPGDIETGFVFNIMPNRAIDHFTIYQYPEDGSTRTMQWFGDLASGDTLTISTVAGSKGVTLLHGGVSSNPLYGVTAQSEWLNLWEGDNDIRVFTEGAAIPYTIDYNVKFGAL